MRKTGHILLIAYIPRVDVSLFISLTFVCLLFINAMLHIIQQQQANLAEGEVEVFSFKVINTTIKIMNSGLENRQMEPFDYCIPAFFVL